MDQTTFYLVFIVLFGIGSFIIGSVLAMGAMNERNEPEDQPSESGH